jgi:hypothetical protein
MQYAIKIFVAALLVVTSSEIAKRFPALGALIIALPITSIIAMSFLYYDTKDTAKISEFSRSIPPIVIPSIAFFYGFSYLMDRNYSFSLSMSLALFLMLAIYGLYLFLSTYIGF